MKIKILSIIAFCGAYCVTTLSMNVDDLYKKMFQQDAGEEHISENYSLQELSAVKELITKEFNRTNPDYGRCSLFKIPYDRELIKAIHEHAKYRKKLQSQTAIIQNAIEKKSRE